jgi:hypothetical protein
MAQSNADRQRAFRVRHMKEENGTGERLNIMIVSSGRGIGHTCERDLAISYVMSGSAQK